MAAIAVEADATEDLTDEQIEQLLRQAEERARNPSSTALIPKHESHYVRAKKTAIVGLPKPYIESNGEVAHADPRRLVEESTRTMANGIRKVEDPLITKKNKLDVSLISLYHYYSLLL